MGRPKKKVILKPEDLVDPEWSTKMTRMWNGAYSQMRQRTAGHKIFTKIAHNESIYNKARTNGKVFSEGSTQAMKRKIRAQTIQRIPDGQIVTQFDKNSIEHVEIEFLFNRKVLTSEYDGKDMLKNLWRAFDSSYDYGFAAVLTGFEKDLDGDVRISFKHIKWNDIFPAPDCDFIEEAPWYWVRSYISRSEIKNLIDHQTGELKDKTYNEDVVKYLCQTHIADASEGAEPPLQDSNKGVFKQESIEVRTLYRRGAKEFTSWIPSLDAKLRTVKNEDPRKDIPIHFLILEPDPEFPLGCSSVMWTLAQQQFADAFQTSAYQSLLLSTEPPLMVYGNVTNQTLAMQPRRVWDMGTNPENRIEKFPVETTTITQYGSILQNVQANMMKNLNITDATIASDAHVNGYSGTPQGVEQQQRDKTITINQYQKRLEVFFSEWANHALRSYINSCSGKIELTVNEETRRKIFDIERAEHGDDPTYHGIINEDKITIDFDALSTDMLEFMVRTGSFIQNQKEEERRAIQDLLVPITQMLPAVSDDNKKIFEENIMHLMQRLCELSDVDLSAQLGSAYEQKLMQDALQETMQAVIGQQGQIDKLAQQQMAIMPQMPEQQPGMQQVPMNMSQEMPPAPPVPGEEMMPPQASEQVSAEFPV